MGNKSARTMCSTISSTAVPAMHYKCRNQNYPRGKDIDRFPVPDDKVKWSESYPDYNPVKFTSESVMKKPVWADKEINSSEDSKDIAWNSLDGKVERRSHMGTYCISNGVPCNPVGRTGVVCRGALGRWGPNHAADPIVTRWKRDDSGNLMKHPTTKKPILQFIAIQRRDTHEWAIPGGMVDPGERVSVTLKREFAEEAMNALEANSDATKEIQSRINNLFKKGIEIYRGYVDDPRNTDNSWMETIAVNFHDDSGDSCGKFKLHAGDDAVGVRWTDLDSSIKLYASHNDFVQGVVQRLNAHW